ncbi:MAG: TonB-dependent receptor, partial [Brevundimonas sp.]
FEQSDIAEYETKTPGYNLLSASVAYGFNIGDTADAEIFVRGTNLLDERAWSHASFLGERAPMRGRGISTGVRVRF